MTTMADLSPSEAAREYHERGFVLLRSFFDARTMERITEDAVLNYAAYPLSVAASPLVVPDTVNTTRIPATLTGANAWIYWDPRVHPFPDNRLITTWPTQTAAAGVRAAEYAKNISRAAFAALSTSWFDQRVTLTGGQRQSWGYGVTGGVDRAMVDDERQRAVGDISVIPQENGFGLHDRTFRDILPRAAWEFDRPARSGQKGCRPRAPPPAC